MNFIWGEGILAVALFPLSRFEPVRIAVDGQHHFSEGKLASISHNTVETRERGWYVCEVLR